MNKEDIPNCGFSVGINDKRAINAYLKSQSKIEDIVSYCFVKPPLINFFISLLIPKYEYRLKEWSEWIVVDKQK